MSPDQKKALVRRSNVLVAGAILSAALFVALPTVSHTVTDLLTIPIACCTPICWFLGLCFYAASKGYSPLYGLLGLLALPGLLILGMLKDRCPIIKSQGPLTMPPINVPPTITSTRHRW